MLFDQFVLQLQQLLELPAFFVQPLHATARLRDRSSQASSFIDPFGDCRKNVANGFFLCRAVANAAEKIDGMGLITTTFIRRNWADDDWIGSRLNHFRSPA